jgi:hypothetical protein
MAIVSTTFIIQAIFWSGTYAGGVQEVEATITEVIVGGKSSDLRSLAADFLDLAAPAIID